MAKIVQKADNKLDNNLVPSQRHKTRCSSPVWQWWPGTEYIAFSGSGAQNIVRTLNL